MKASRSDLRYLHWPPTFTQGRRLLFVDLHTQSVAGLMFKYSAAWSVFIRPDVAILSTTVFAAVCIIKSFRNVAMDVTLKVGVPPAKDIRQVFWARMFQRDEQWQGWRLL